MYMHMTTISDFMSFSAWQNKAKLKSPHFLLQGVPVRTFFFKSSKIRNGVRTLLPTKIRLDTGRTMMCSFFVFFATDVWTGAKKVWKKTEQRYEDVVCCVHGIIKTSPVTNGILLWYEKSIFSLIITRAYCVRVHGFH